MIKNNEHNNFQNVTFAMFLALLLHGFCLVFDHQSKKESNSYTDVENGFESHITKNKVDENLPSFEKSPYFGLDLDNLGFVSLKNRNTGRVKEIIGSGNNLLVRENRQIVKKSLFILYSSLKLDC